MEFWLIISKLIVFIYLALHFIDSEVTNIPWIVFTFLLYLSLNILIYIIKNILVKKVIILLCIIFTIISYQHIHPFFILFLPMNICEIASYYFQKRWAVFILLFLPVFFIENSLILIWSLVAVFSFVIFMMAELYTNRLWKLENQMDQMRKDMQRITKSLHENNEFIRQSEYTFKLEERNRLSQVIHDNIGHSMTGALIQMEASKRLISTDQVKAVELLQNAINISKDGIENIRITLKNMKPPSEQMGVNRLKLFIDDFAAKSDLQTPFVYKGNLDVITPIQWKIIQENVVEAFTNSLKYSSATSISIEIHVLNAIVRVEVKDNGKGAPKIKKGLGIVGMEERTAAINGTIIVDGTNGFSVTMLLPRL